VEALACGLPVVYQRGSGHDDLVGKGGLGYDKPSEIPALLENIADNYSLFQSNIQVESMSDIGARYLEVLKSCKP
jgi:glycosyltransferase involved in cell wall biosynthesis